MIRDYQSQRPGGIEQGIFEQETRRAADQVVKGLWGVAEAEGEQVRVACCVLRDQWHGKWETDGAGLAQHGEWQSERDGYYARDRRRGMRSGRQSGTP